MLIFLVTTMAALRALTEQIMWILVFYPFFVVATMAYSPQLSSSLVHNIAYKICLSSTYSARREMY